MAADPACVVCGCQEESPCAVGCSWVLSDPPLCSACADIGEGIRKAIKKHSELMLVFGLASVRPGNIAGDVRRRRH